MGPLELEKQGDVATYSFGYVTRRARSYTEIPAVRSFTDCQRASPTSGLLAAPKVMSLRPRGLATSQQGRREHRLRCYL